MAGLINWKKVAPPASNPDTAHVYVGIDVTDCKLYIKDDTGAVFKYETTADVAATIAASLSNYDLSTVVDTKISDAINTLINGAGSALDTLNELAVALGNDPNFATTVANNIAVVQADINAHEANTSNPHATTKTQVGLGNVDNTSDVNKPVSTATQTALNAKENTGVAATLIATHEALANPHPIYETSVEAQAKVDAHANLTNNPHSTTAAQVGLGNVNNTSDANKPISTATQTALNLKYDATNPNGYETPAQLDARDTANRARANHTGTQLKSTISDFAHTHPLSEITQSGATSGQVATWNGSAWVPQNLGGDTVLRVTATQSVATVTPTTVTQLTTPSLAVGWYEITSINIVQSTAIGTGIGMRLAPVTATIGVISAKWSIGQGADGTDKDFGYLQNLTTTNVTTTAALAANTDFSAQALGIFQVTVAGTVAIQLRSETGTSVSIRNGSILILKKVL
jgi:hypothetical protein